MYFRKFVAAAQIKQLDLNTELFLYKITSMLLSLASPKKSVQKTGNSVHLLLLKERGTDVSWEEDRKTSVISPKYEGSKDTCYRWHDGISSTVQAQPGATPLPTQMESHSRTGSRDPVYKPCMTPCNQPNSFFTGRLDITSKPDLVFAKFSGQ